MYKEVICRGYVIESTLALYFTTTPTLLILYEEYHKEWTFSNIKQDLFKCKFELKENLKTTLRYVTHKDKQFLPLTIVNKFLTFSQLKIGQDVELNRARCFEVDLSEGGEQFSELVVLNQSNYYRYFNISYARINLPLIHISNFALDRENEEIKVEKQTLDYS